MYKKECKCALDLLIYTPKNADRTVNRILGQFVHNGTLTSETHYLSQSQNSSVQHSVSTTHALLIIYTSRHKISCSKIQDSIPNLLQPTLVVRGFLRTPSNELLLLKDINGFLYALEVSALLTRISAVK